MRLAVVSRRHRLKQKLILSIIRLMTRAEPLDVIKTMFYRPEFFGRPYSELLESVMRGDGEWEVGERELFAAFTSAELACNF